MLGANRLTSMSNNTETKSVSLINPDAYPQMIEMFKQSIESHQRDIDKAHDLIEAFGEGEHEDLFEHEDLICDALNLLINDKEESIARLHEGIEELEKVS